jgi:hypothetical protein
MTSRPIASDRATLAVRVVTLTVLVSVLAVGLAGAGAVVSPGTTFEASDTGPTVTVTEELELDDSAVFPDGQTVSLSPHATFESDGDTNVTVEQITGAWTNLTTHDVGAGLEIDPGDKQAVTVEGGDVRTLNVSAVDTATADEADLVYDAGAALTLTVAGLPPNTVLDVVNPNTGEQLTQATTDGSGDLSVTLASGEQAVAFATAQSNVQVDITGTNGPVTAGETATVTAALENTGSVSTTQTIELRRYGLVVEDIERTLAAGETDRLTFEWPTRTDDAGDYSLVVASADDSDATTVTVETASGSGSDSTPTPTETPSTPTPTPDETPTPDGEPTPTATPDATPTPTPDDSQPTSTATPTGTPSPGEGTDRDSDDGSGPGFGSLTAVVGLACFLLVFRRGENGQ